MAAGRLVICPTPIGNLEDVTLRVLSALREADVVACEDTRRTRVLLDRYGVKAKLVSYHEHNERARAGELVGRMRAGAVVALVSDAGMPLISDPGFELVRTAVAAGLPVEVLPGPSAALAALVASGLPADAWHFVGFLPRKRGELVGRMRAGAVVALVSDAGMPLISDPGFELVRTAVAAGLPVEVLPGPSAALAALVASGLPADAWHFVGFLPRKRGELERLFAMPETLVAFESPRRVASSLAVLAASDQARPVAVARELTKVHEEVVRGEAATVAERYAASPPRGEVVLVVGPATTAAPDLAPAVDALRRLVEAGAKPRPAAKVVAELTGAPANALYEALQE